MVKLLDFLAAPPHPTNEGILSEDKVYLYCMKYFV